VFTSPSRSGSSPSSISSFLIRSCIRLFYISAGRALPGALCVLGTLCAISASAQVAATDPDALYARRTDLASAERAADLWADALQRQPAGPSAFENAWKLARACYWLGGHEPEDRRRAAFERGIAAGRQAAALKSDRPEGYFWMAANMGALAESFGLRQGLKYRKPIKEALETVLRIDPAFQEGSADRALGRWYAKVPRLFGGSDREAEAHLRASLRYNPVSTASHYFLAELLLDNGRKADARTELQAVLDAPLNPEWTAEDREFKDKARRLLEKTK
jgi:TRAP transporter TatT component family protein